MNRCEIWTKRKTTKHPGEDHKTPEKQKLFWETVSDLPLIPALFLIHSTLRHLQVIGRSTPGSTQAWHVRPRLAHVSKPRCISIPGWRSANVGATWFKVLLALMEILVFMFVDAGDQWKVQPSYETPLKLLSFPISLPFACVFCWKSCVSKSLPWKLCFSQKGSRFQGLWIYTWSFALIWQGSSSRSGAHNQTTANIFQLLHKKLWALMCPNLRGKSWFKIYRMSSFLVPIRPCLPFPLKVQSTKQSGWSLGWSMDPTIGQAVWSTWTSWLSEFPTFLSREKCHL